MRERERHRGESFGCRVDDDHRVLEPRLACAAVAYSAPQVDELLTSVIHAARATELVALGEVLDECVTHGLEARVDESTDLMMPSRRAAGGRGLRVHGSISADVIDEPERQAHVVTRRRAGFHGRLEACDVVAHVGSKGDDSSLQLGADAAIGRRAAV